MRPSDRKHADNLYQTRADNPYQTRADNPLIKK